MSIFTFTKELVPSTVKRRTQDGRLDVKISETLVLTNEPFTDLSKLQTFRH